MTIDPSGSEASPARRHVPAVLALDIGGTQIRAATVLEDGARLGREATPTPLAEGREAILRACVDLLERSRATAPPAVRAAVAGIGISSAGPVDPWRGTIVDPPNMPPLHGVALARELECALGLPAFLERDTNVAALAEQWRGAARGCRDFLYVTVSTGLGGAVVRQGRLMLGPDGTAGELGHGPFLLEGGPLCGCGGRAHLEAISSGSGLARQAADAVAVGSSPFLAARAAAGARLSGRDVAEGEDAGDSTCAALMAAARRAFAMACVGWVNSFNPERIVVGGTIAERQGARLLDPARRLVREQSFAIPAGRVEIVAAELGEDVGLAGAWPLVAQRLGDPQWLQAV